MKFKDFLKLPTIFRNREQKIEDVVISNIQIKNIDNNTSLISAVTNNKYNTQIQINKITFDTKVYCECDSFKYEFAHVLYKYKALLNEEIFVEMWKHTQPRKTTRRKNPYNIPCGCKHIIKLCRYIFLKNLLNRRL